MSKQELEHKLEMEQAFNSFLMGLHNADKYQDAANLIKSKLLTFIEAERFTIYQNDLKSDSIISKTKKGEEFQEIKLLRSTSSIAGYVALSHKSLMIKDAYDKSELQAIDPDLRFEWHFDRENGYKTKSMIVVPIKWGDVLLGVLQIINHKNGQFSTRDFNYAKLLAEAIAQKLRYDAQATSGPFEYLIQNDKITLEQLKEAEAKARNLGTDVAGVLLTKRLASLSDIAYSLERYYQVPFVGFNSIKPMDKNLMQGLNLRYLAEQHWAPIERNGNEITILIDDPSNSQKILEISHILHAESYKFCVGMVRDILKYIENKSQSDDKTKSSFEDLDKQIQELDKNIHKVNSLNESNFIIVEFVDQLIIHAFDKGASDIHIEPRPNNEAAIIRLRIDGICQDLGIIPNNVLSHIIARIKILGALDIADHRLPQDGKITLEYGEIKIELRVVVVPTIFGESAVLRILPYNNVMPFERLDFSERNTQMIKQAIKNRIGIFFVVGATGSGKTTTLHSLLSYISTPSKKFFTIEDPVEITQDLIQQVQVKNKIGLTFAEALHMLLRADPDVIMVGEVRDQETGEMAVHASLTGHLVFSTLHANSAPLGISRLIDLGIKPVNFADSLLGILSQSLVRRLCTKCKKSELITEEEYQSIRDQYGDECFPELHISLENTLIFHAKGCKSCSMSGYQGRIAIHEVLLVNDKLKYCLRQSADLNEIKEIATQAGMRTMKQDAIKKVLQGKIDLKQALSVD